MTARGAAVFSLVALSVFSFFVFYAFGALVSHRPPNEIEHYVYNYTYGMRVPLAVKFTKFGTLPVYVGVVFLSFAIALVRRRWLRDAMFALGSLVLAWQTSDYFKLYFMRHRPGGALYFNETSFGYPSGHATLAMAFYGAWAFFVWRSPLPGPIRFIITLALACLIVGIGWSRLALGAHYLSDVLGGYLLGFTFAALAVVLSRLRAVPLL